MAGLIAKLFGGKTSPAVNMEPVPGIGGYTLGAGPANQTGFPGSTSQTRTLPSNGRIPNSPRAAKIRGDYDSDANNYTGTTTETRQASYRGSMGQGSGQGNDTRSTESVVTQQTAIRQEMQTNSTAEFFGGPPLKTRQGDLTAGGYLNRRAAQAMGLPSADSRDTMTPWVEAQPNVGGNTPGSANVRNTVAQRYKAKPGELHTYKSAARADQAPVNPGGQATDGNVHPERVVQDVTVPSRFEHDGLTSWSVNREMPYGGRGNGARGADLNGQRYYATGQAQQFLNAGQGDYGVARLEGGGNKRPVAFTQPAPWTSNFYDTTDSVGTTDDPNVTPEQQPQAIYYSPGGLRASNSTGRTG